MYNSAKIIFYIFINEHVSLVMSRYGEPDDTLWAGFFVAIALLLCLCYRHCWSSQVRQAVAVAAADAARRQEAMAQAPVAAEGITAVLDVFVAAANAAARAVAQAIATPEAQDTAPGPDEP